MESILDAAHAIKLNIGRVVGQKNRKDEEIRKEIIEDYERQKEGRGILDSDKIIEMPNLDKIPLEPYDDVVGFILEYGNLEEWEKDIVKIVKRETEYFLPQIETKTMNEGWASFGITQF